MHFKSIISFGIVAATMAAQAARIEHCTKPNTIALTFDDGPYKYSEKLLDTLKKAGIHATFFINGDNYWGDLTHHERGRKIIKRMATDGHQIASHTWKHEIPSTKAAIKESMDKLDNLIEDITGKRPKYFRAPQGNCGESCVADFEALGYKVIYWDTDTNDWDIEKTKPKDRVVMAKKYLKSRWNEKNKNYLILMHETYQHSVEQLVPWIIKNKPKGYKFVTVAECLGDSNATGAISGSGSGNKVGFKPENGTAGATGAAGVAGATGTTGAAGAAGVAGATGTTGAGVAGAAGAAGATGTTTGLPGSVPSSIIQGNNTLPNTNSTLEGNKLQLTSGAMTYSSNLYVFTALILYSLYMFL